MKTEQELKDELIILEEILGKAEICKHHQEKSIKETKARIETIEWVLRS